jgi:hypothetical protein
VPGPHLAGQALGGGLTVQIGDPLGGELVGQLRVHLVLLD